MKLYLLSYIMGLFVLVVRRNLYPIGYESTKVLGHSVVFHRLMEPVPYFLQDFLVSLCEFPILKLRPEVVVYVGDQATVFSAVEGRRELFLLFGELET